MMICCSLPLWTISGQLYGAAFHSWWKENTQIHENTDGTYRLHIKGLDRHSSLSRDVQKLTGPNYFENVCIHAGDVMYPFYDQFVARLNIYSGSRGNHKEYSGQSLLYEVNWITDKHTNFWLLHLHDRQVPSNWPVLPVVAYFPWYWRTYGNIFALWCHTAPGIYQQIKWSRAHIAGLETASLESYVVVPAHLQYFRTHYAQALTDMGINKVKIFQDLWLQGPVCFKYGVFGSHHDVTANATTPDDMGQVLQAKWNLTSPCVVNNSVLLLNRYHTRRILNARKIIHHLNKRGYNVKLDYFKNKSLQEQMDSVRCASVFIGAQGAGLSWYQFLPPNSTFIELHWYGWISKYKRRAEESRPDISAHAIECKPVTPLSIWQGYARKWFNHRGPIDDIMKQRLREKSDRVQDVNDVAGTIWKDSDCECNIDEIARLLPLAKTS